MEADLILKIAHIDPLLYSPALIGVFVLHQQELFLKTFKKEGRKRNGKHNNSAKNLNIFCKYENNTVQVYQGKME